jgi:hypothetical protein
MSIIRLEKLLKSATDSPLEQLVRRSETMQRLTMKLKAGLAPGLAPHLTAANLRPDGQLVLVAESSGWAARLRFESESLMQIARDDGEQVHTCRVIVAKENSGDAGEAGPRLPDQAESIPK